ncbi:hypothetical protein B5M09_008927 [Aphanomyces astaci]|uniref:Uncharacterized protein n=1 Tax=Aphanomyces astaci TaxID=112090 RepID=A0A425CZ00_APHAT|nr:hypothetical protein B5M09_008927 [Aphanomyces astaci]
MLATTPAMCGAAMDVPAISRYQLKLSASADLYRSRGGDVGLGQRHRSDGPHTREYMLGLPVLAHAGPESPLEKTGVIPAARHDVTMSSYAELYPRMNRPNATSTSDDPELPYSPKHSTGVSMTMPLYGLNQPLLKRQLCLSASWRYFSPVSTEPTTTPLPLKCLQMAGAPIVLTLQWGTVAFKGM